MKLYEKVAVRIEEMIGKGIYEPGERLPSIRRLSEQLRVSVNTVREAYSLLEDRRVACARSGSGFFVEHVPTRTSPDMAASLDAVAPRPVTVSDLSYTIHEDAASLDLLPLGVAMPPMRLLPAKRLLSLHTRALRSKPESSIAYEFSPGRYSLRQNIAKRLLDVGCVVSADDITITSGCLDAVTMSLLATCRAGDTVAIETPVFFFFLQLLQCLGLQIIEIPSSPRTGMNLDVLEFTLRHYPVSACLTTPNFSNPTGSLMPDDHKERLVRLAEAHGVALIEDDVYGELYFGNERPRVLRSFDRSGNVVLCSSFSKTVAPGYRIGWVVGGRHSEAIRRTKMMTSVSAPSISVTGMESFLESGGLDRTLRAARRSYRISTARVSDAILAAFPEGTRVVQPQGGMVVWVELPEEVDSVELYMECRTRKISIAPGVIFSAQERFRNYVRISGTEWTPAVEEAIRTVGNAAHVLAERGSRLAVGR